MARNPWPYLVRGPENEPTSFAFQKELCTAKRDLLLWDGMPKPELGLLDASPCTCWDNSQFNVGPDRLESHTPAFNRPTHEVKFGG